MTITEETNNTASRNDVDDAIDAEGGSSGPEEGAENEEETTNNHEVMRATSSENFVPASAVEPAPSSLRCRFLPHGVYAVMPALFSIMAWFA